MGPGPGAGGPRGVSRRADGVTLRADTSTSMSDMQSQDNRRTPDRMCGFECHVYLSKDKDSVGPDQDPRAHRQVRHGGLKSTFQLRALAATYGIGNRQPSTETRKRK
eukprot:1916921-Prymnesium_polylepis.1